MLSTQKSSECVLCKSPLCKSPMSSVEGNANTFVGIFTVLHGLAAELHQKFSEVQFPTVLPEDLSGRVDLHLSQKNCRHARSTVWTP